MRKNEKEVHEVHQPFCFMSLGGELATFPHVHEVHNVHEVHSANERFSNCQRTYPIAGSPVGQSVPRCGTACIALIPHFLIACQAKQGAVVDVVWNQ
jgi:hypothetical protein